MNQEKNLCQELELRADAFRKSNPFEDTDKVIERAIRYIRALEQIVASYKLTDGPGKIPPFMTRTPAPPPEGDEARPVKLDPSE